MNDKKTSTTLVALLGLSSVVGCMGHTTIGDDSSAGGAAGSGGTSNSIAGHASFGGIAAGGSGNGSVGGIDGSGCGIGGGPTVITCPATIRFDEGRQLGLQAGPHNEALLPPRMFREAVFNYQENIVMEGAMKAGGAFEANADDKTLGPASGADLEPFLGQVELVPPACVGTDVTGRTLTVHYFVRLTGAIGTFPAHGAFLGSEHAGEFTFYEDAVTHENIINRLAQQTLQHTFTAEEAADVAANGAYLNLYSLEAVPIDLYVGDIIWD